MTREKAIKRLEDTFEAWERWNPDNDSPASKLSEALGMAISALREKEERSKGCDFCNERNVAVMSASILTFDLKHHGCTCRFCPMCGRKLEVEG